jgi:hypothetical protein
LTIGEDKHPADEIGLALARASGILSSIANCYEPGRGEFATGAAFIAEAVSAAESIIAKANRSLDQLYSNYSLLPLDEQDLIVELPRHVQAAQETAVSQFIPRSPVSELSQKLDNILSVLPEVPFDQIDQPARTYDELLYKLTSMTNAASQDDEMRPMLESLRNDMLRIRTAV